MVVVNFWFKYLNGFHLKSTPDVDLAWICSDFTINSFLGYTHNCESSCPCPSHTVDLAMVLTSRNLANFEFHNRILCLFMIGSVTETPISIVSHLLHFFASWHSPDDSLTLATSSDQEVIFWTHLNLMDGACVGLTMANKSLSLVISELHSPNQQVSFVASSKDKLVSYVDCKCIYLKHLVIVSKVT